MQEQRRGRLRVWLGWIVLAVLAVLALPYVAVVAYTVVDPPSLPVLARQLGGEPVTQRQVALSSVSPHLVRAVVTSEDAAFCTHWGIDLRAIRDALARAENRNGAVRGTSTIPMQTVKNLFLWSDRSFIRKVLEAPLALWADLVWSKPRMLEIYLNLAEWGPGIFGIEAAAQHHFGVSAANLTAQQALLLATALPNPARRPAGNPTALQRRLAERLSARVTRAPADLSCLPGFGTGS